MSKGIMVNKSPAVTTITAGMGFRNSIRQELDSVASFGITYSETKGVFQSVFVVSGPEYLLAGIEKMFR